MWIGKSDANVGCGCSAGSIGIGNGQDIIVTPIWNKSNTFMKTYVMYSNKGNMTT